MDSNEATRHCGNCHRELPVGSFYQNKRTGRIDSYCRECRCRASRLQRKADEPAGTPPRRYPVITATADRDLRLALIFQAKQVVRKRYLRWRDRDNEE